MDNIRHGRTNRWHSTLLVLVMAAVLALCGYLLAGHTGLVVALLMAMGIVIATGRVSAAMVLRMYRATPISRVQAPGLADLFDTLTARANLEIRPRLYYVPSGMVNAFATGRGEQVAVAVTDGLLRRLDGREIAGVLAHEISHIVNDDVFVMTLADAFTRVTALLGQVGIWMLLLSVPAILAGYQFPWLAGLVFVIAPSFNTLMQLALSRSREYDADEGAARLTGDPVGLALALRKIQRFQGGWMERVFLPGRREPEPAILRTHPPTEERIAILKRMAGLDPREPLPVDFPQMTMPGSRRRIRDPRWHFSGLWY
jgi:heat shock protein HtpX